MMNFQTILASYFKNWPAGTSAKTLFHLAQNALSGKKIFQNSTSPSKTNLNGWFFLLQVYLELMITVVKRILKNMDKRNLLSTRCPT